MCLAGIPESRLATIATSRCVFHTGRSAIFLLAPCPSTPFSSLPHCRRRCSRPPLAMFSTQYSSAVLELSSSLSNYSSFALDSSVHRRPSPSSSPTSSALFPSTVRYVLTQPFPFPWATFLATILTVVPSRQLTTTSPLTLMTSPRSSALFPLTPNAFLRHGLSSFSIPLTWLPDPCPSRPCTSCILSIPLALACSIPYKEFFNRRGAAIRGAVLALSAKEWDRYVHHDALSNPYLYSCLPCVTTIYSGSPASYGIS